MTAPRLLGLLVVALCLTVAAVSTSQGLPPGVKLPPQIKPGPGGIPGGPVPKPGPMDPGKGKNPMPLPGGPGTPPGPGTPSGSVPTKPADKKDDIKWPKEVNGKTVEAVVKEMRGNSDPAIREAAIRMLPAFGPKGREQGGQELVDAMTKDPDWNVRVAALEVGPMVLYQYAYLTGPDTILQNGLTAMMNSLSSGQMGIRITAVAAIGAVGPYMRTPYPKVLSSLITPAKDSTSYQLRRMATAAIGTVGLGVQISENPEADRGPPDTGAVTSLLDILKNDNCALVRREAVNALIGLGPVAGGQQKKWRADLEYVVKNEKDKSVALWTRVCILRNDPAAVDGNPIHLDAVAKTLEAPEPAGRLEACQALGLLGDEAKAKLQDLLNVVQNAKEEPAIVAAAIMAVSTMKSQVKIILPILNSIMATHPNMDVRKVATEAIEYVTGRKKN